jgi:hypothetical protein
MTSFATAKLDAHTAQSATITALHAMGSNQPGRFGFVSDDESDGEDASGSSVWDSKDADAVSLLKDIGESKLLNIVPDVTSSSVAELLRGESLNCDFDNLEASGESCIRIKF